MVAVAVRRGCSSTTSPSRSPLYCPPRRRAEGPGAAAHHRPPLPTAAAELISPSFSRRPLSAELKDLASRRIIGRDGTVDPVVLPCTMYTCFAVLDFVQRVQFVGFSRDMRNTLRKILVHQARALVT